MPVETVDPPTSSAAPEVDAQPPLLARARWRHFSWRHFPWSRALLLLVGMLLGAAILATFQAAGAVSPPPVRKGLAEQESDIIVSIRQSYLDRLIAERLAEPGSTGPLENIKVNVQPGQRVNLEGDVNVMSQRLRATANGSIGVVNGRVHVAFDRVKVGALNLPAQLGDVVAAPINAELERISAGDDFTIVDVATTTDRLIVRLAANGPSQSR